MSSIIRVEKNKDYFSALNEPFQNSALSWAARGILAYLLSKPDDWEVRNHDLYNQSPAGRKHVDRCLKELKDAGYLRRFREQDDKGHWHWVSVIYEDKTQNPDYEKPDTPKKERSGSDTPKSERSGTERSETGQYTNNGSQSTELQSTDNKGAQKPAPTPAKSSKPAAVEKYREIARLWPDKSLWEMIDNTVGSDESDLTLWENVIRNYIACGWNKRNVKAMLEFYGRGEIPATNGKERDGRINGHSSKRSKPLAGTGEYLAQQPTYDPYTGEYCLP